MTLYNRLYVATFTGQFAIAGVSCISQIIHSSQQSQTPGVLPTNRLLPARGGRQRFRLVFEEGSPPTVVQCVVFRGFSTVMPEHWFGIRHGYLLRSTQESPCNHLSRSYITTGTEARPLHNPHQSRNLVRTFNTKPGIQSCNQLKLFSYKRDLKVNAEFRTCRQNPNRGDRGKGLG